MIEARTLWELVDRRAGETPDGLLGVDEAERTMSFGEFRDAALEVAAALHADGLRAGARVSWILPTRFDALVLMAALARLGAVQNPIIPIYRHREVGFCLRQTGAELLVVPGAFRSFDYEGLAADMAREIEGLRTMVVRDGLPTGDPDTLPPPPPPESGKEVRWLFYTSGTTADPKGARHTDFNILASSRGMAEAWDLGPSDRIAMVFPVTHLGGANSLTAGLFSGAGHLVVEQFNPPETVPFLAAHGVTHAGAGTVFHQAYLAAQRAAGPEPIFPKIRLFQGGGAAKPPQLHYDLKREAGGAGVLSVYGMTECPIISLGRMGDSDESLSLTEGRPNLAETEILVLGGDGQPVPTGEEGELRIKTPQLCLGYLDESLNAEAFDDDGYFKTGDIGRIDEGGNVVITGRLKDVIIRKGENISALEIENLLHAHPKVADCAVIGVPDEERGEMACAVIVPADAADPIGLEEMASHLKAEQLMVQKIPERLELIDALPKNPTGKVLKRELRRRFGA